MTVDGLVSAQDLGIVLPHEHLIVQGWDYRERNYANSLSMELAKYISAGGKTIVEVSSAGQARDPLFFRDAARRAGVHLVVGTGFYKAGWLSTEEQALEVADLAERMTTEILVGIGATGIHAGVIGEIGISRPIHAVEEKVLAACAVAQKKTGVAISLHFDLGTEIQEYHQALDLLEREGADLSRVVVGHLVSRPDTLPAARELAGRGCYLGFDLFGQERWPLMRDLIHTPADVQVSSIKGFIHFGLLDRLLLSQNVCHVDLLTVNGGDGYAHLLMNVVPVLSRYQISQAEIRTILQDNPQRLLAIQ